MASKEEKKYMPRSRSFLDKLKKYAPAALLTLASWLPLESARSSAPKDDMRKNPIENLARTDISDDTPPMRLAMAEKGRSDAYNETIAQISINTEAGNYSNPAAVATGNGYYGQHQFGVSSNSGYMVRKYIAYALAYGTDEFRKSLSDHLLIGSTEKKNRLIDEFMVSAGKYEDQGKFENAFLPSNPAYKKLFNIMNVNPTNFKAAHKNFAEEGAERQKMFVYTVYLNLMPTSLKQIMKKHPNIAFDEIHPATWGAVIAIAIKQGNGGKFDRALTALEQGAKNKIIPTINSDAWLKNYCGKNFRKVYNQAAPMLKKVPTLDTYLEMSIFLRMPELYKKANDFWRYQNPVMQATIAANDGSEKNDAFRLRASQDREKITRLHADNTGVLATNITRQRQNRQGVSKKTLAAQVLKKMQDRKINRV